ncbi:hypothetical protein NHX12_034473 [Muraenolepis orangiensis]|uniref:Centrosomal protein POC5 n=1 Tax=Muraenolepis orangiensis TaxID=630683 RepID=A0A9Q0I1G8_9TELE|nr:hypothetical protein NHX12_034473 [Muraenolepis orangiensis]
MNLTKALDKQKEKMEVMRTFAAWRLRLHQLKRKVWLGWHGLLQKHWKDKVERACRARAEEMCVRLSSDYEARIAQHCEAVEDAQAEIQKLRVDRERYEESMKKAFMRGVCALNMEALTMEALTMFQPPAEGRPEASDAAVAAAAATAAAATAHHHHLHHHQHGEIYAIFIIIIIIITTIDPMTHSTVCNTELEKKTKKKDTAMTLIQPGL